MKNPFESPIPQPTPEDIDSIIEHAKTESNEVLDQVIINYMNTPLGDAIHLSKEVLVRMNELKAKDFSDVKSWLELYATIAAKGELEMAGKMMSDKEVIKIIGAIRSGDLPLTNVTRNGGLRKKVEELLVD